MLETEARGLVGDRTLRAVVVEDNATGHRHRLPASALFMFIGADPCTGWLADAVALDDHDFVLTGESARAAAPHEWPGSSTGPAMLETTAPGVYAVGDVRSGSIKRVASAVGEGAMAVRLVHAHLAHSGHTRRGGG
jgi:thioredoxin reductase (NADPH)